MIKIKVSIIIPVYNGSNYLSEAIDSALAQTYKNIEIIVVNDGSIDDGATEKLVKSYGDKIKYFSKKNGGVSTALNLGIEKMTGEYFSWLSHDDLYYPNKIEEQIVFLEKQKDKNIVVFSNFEFIKSNGDKLYGSSIDYMQPKQILYKSLIGFPLNGCSLLIKKTFFYDVGVFDEKIKNMQDYDMWFKLMREYKFVMIDKVLVKNRRHNEQDSNTKTIRGINDKKKLNSKVLKLFSMEEIRESSESKLPVSLFKFYLRFRLFLLQFVSYGMIVTRKLGIHTFVTPLARKLFFK